MKSNVTNMLRILSEFVLVLLCTASLVSAQQPSPSPKQSDAKTQNAATQNGNNDEDEFGNYSVISSIEFGYRGIRVDGDLNKYRSDLNYKAGPRLFDTSFLLKSKDGKGGGLFDTFLVTSSGWGADPSGQMRISAENSKWYRFEGSYRRFKYFRFLNNLANPNWVFSPASFSRPPDPVTGDHGYNIEQQLGDFDLTILPKNELIKFTVGYSPERYSGPAFTNYHLGGNEFLLLSQLKSRANDFRVGADGKLGPIDFSFLQGFRRFRDDSFINLGNTPGINLNPAVARFTTFTRDEPTRGSVNYTRFSAHTLVAKKLDLTGRIIYSRSSSNSVFAENFSGLNFNPRVTGWPPTPPAATPNILNRGGYNIASDSNRPSTIGDFGATFFATDHLRISNTFRVEDFTINGFGLFSDTFTLTRGSRTDTVTFSNLDATKITKYRKYQDTVEGDYQFNSHYSMHFGYRYGTRRIQESFDGFALNSNGSVTPPVARSADEESETNHTHSFFGGFKARPINNWTLYFDAERGTADNLFTRIGNYNYTNLRAKTRYVPSRKVSFNLALISRNNANPSEIAGVSLADFGVNIKSRIFTSSVDWSLTPKLSFSAGYTYNWVNSNAVVDYFFNSVRHPLGHSLYFMRNSYFYLDSVAQVTRRATLYMSYRINRDTGQGTRLSDPTGNPGFLVTSYPMNYQSPEARLAIRINRRLDWNLGYQYYNYNESLLVGPRPQNYHAHLPYTSLRIYFGRKE